MTTSKTQPRPSEVLQPAGRTFLHYANGRKERIDEEAEVQRVSRERGFEPWEVRAAFDRLVEKGILSRESGRG